MNTNKLIYPELSYAIVGICFAVHNEKGRFAREKQYADTIEEKLKEVKIPYKREFWIGDAGDKVDFLIDNKIILEVKAKRTIVREDYRQLQRYLQSSGIRLGLLINFRMRYIKPLRIVKIDKDVNPNYKNSYSLV
jgi:GxxExxY protein